MAAVTAPARADVIGIAVDAVGSITQVGNNTGDTIDFYIPLSGDGEMPDVYDDTTGTSSDSCVYGTTCGGGLLEIILYFNPVEAGSAELSLLFTDLDIEGVNDPWFFLETLQILHADGTVIDTIDVADLSVPVNSTSQLIEQSITITTQPEF